MNPRQIVTLVVAVISIFVIVSMASSLVEYLPGNEQMIIQNAFTGRLVPYFQPGPKGQWFGAATHYLKRDQYSFSSAKDQGSNVDQSIKVQFAEGGTAQISGVLSWEMPNDDTNFVRLHTFYGSQEAVEQQLVRPAIERALYLTGTLMTSTEAYSARKADFLRYFEDQLKNGIYETRTTEVKQPDPITGTEKTVKIVEIVLGQDGQIVRASASPLKEFGIGILPPAISDIAWDPIVKNQIAEQQKAITQVQTAQAQAKEAEQKAITVEKQGEANAASAKWEQEVLKAKAVTAAEQQRDVNKLNAEAASFYKQQQILEGEGDAEKQRLKMQANGALEQKLQTYITVQQVWADAFKNYQGALVPSVVTGGGGTAGGSNAGINFMELMGIKAAKDLSLDLSVPSGGGKK